MPYSHLWLLQGRLNYLVTVVLHAVCLLFFLLMSDWKPRTQEQQTGIFSGLQFRGFTDKFFIDTFTRYSVTGWVELPYSDRILCLQWAISTEQIAWLIETYSNSKVALFLPTLFSLMCAVVYGNLSFYL